MSTTITYLRYLAMLSADYVRDLDAHIMGAVTLPELEQTRAALDEWSEHVTRLGWEHHDAASAVAHVLCEEDAP
jgi:hypothetical protein